MGRCIDDMKKILYIRYPEGKPDVMCSVTPTTLLCVDKSENLSRVQWLDLSGKKPKPAAGRQIIYMGNLKISDMCFVQDKHLLVVTDYLKGIFAYNTETGTLKWQVDEKPPGIEKDMHLNAVTADERGHMLVSDRNNECIHVLSVSDGSYIRCFLKGDDTLGRPEFIRWCKETSSLIAACYVQEKSYLKIIEAQF